MEYSHGRWRGAAGRYLSAEAIARLPQAQQLLTPHPSVSPAPQALSQDSRSSSPSLSSVPDSIDSSPRRPASDIPFPPSPANNNGYLPDSETDENHPRADSPRTPRRPRPRHSSVATTPHAARALSDSSEDESEGDPHQNSPTVVRLHSRPAALPSSGVAPAQPPAQATTTLPTGTQTPPSLGSAVASVLVGPMSIRDAFTQIQNLCGGQFYDDGRPKPEVEYRRNFIAATIGLTDEQIASLWVSNLVLDGPAFDWHEDLIQTASGKVSAEKWSTLLPEIEKRWPTPPRDRNATKLRHRKRWREHSFNIQGMVTALADSSSSTKPHQIWAQQHKSLGAAITGMSDGDKVLQTLEILPIYVIELLPKQDRYGDDWDTLIKDIGEISSRLLLSRYEQHSLIDSMYSMSLAHQTRPPTPSRWGTRTTQTQQQSTTSTLARRTPGTRFDPTPQVIPEPASQPAQAPPAPNTTSRPPAQRPFVRDGAPHMQQTPHTPGPLSSVVSRVTATVEPPPVGARKIPDTPADKAKWASEVRTWKEQNRGLPHSLKRPFPFRPGTFEQTADSCTKCGLADHYSYACEAEGQDVLDDKEQGYRRVLARKLREDRRAGTQPGTPSPGQRYRDVAQIEFEEPDFDPESDLGSGNE
ncbi:Retrovirus-related Pol polyprotein from transposon [Ceratobasidium sp. AG-Ba]|nr:Retrovirus-related Pol polyprotein from transposon [Ceratobasidium sp. AG-Ba]